MIPTQDFYTILGVSRSSEENEIKKAYYKLCLRWHPDKNKTPGAEDKFKEINKAYETLSDPKKRSLYDLQSEFECDLRSSRYSTDASACKPSRSETYTFRDSNHDDAASTTNKWSQFNSKTSDSSSRSNGGSYRKNFYKKYRKYFDSGFFFNVESDDENYDNYNSNSTNEYYDNDFEADSNSTAEDLNSSSTLNNEWSSTSNNAKSTKNEYKYHAAPNDPFDLFETFECFRLYRLFSEMSSRLFDDVNDEEMLVNLAKIISSFSMPEPSKKNSKTKTDKSDFVYEAKTATKSDENKKMSNQKSESQSGKNDWEFEWLGKSSSSSSRDSKKSESPVNVDDEEIDASSETSASPYECFYCSKQLLDKESLDKHQSVCKRSNTNLNKHKSKLKNESSSSPNSSTLSSSTSSSTSSSLTTECPKCKLTFTTYDFLLHQCTHSNLKKPNATYNASTTTTKSKTATHQPQPLYKPFVHQNSTRFKDLLANSKTANPSAFKPVINRRLNDETKTAKPAAPQTQRPHSPPTTFSNSDFVFSKLKTKSVDPHCSSTSPKRSSRLSSDAENSKPKLSTSSSHRNIYSNNYQSVKKSADTKLNGSTSERGYNKPAYYASPTTTTTTTTTPSSTYKTQSVSPNTFKSYANLSKPYSPVVVNPTYSNIKLANRGSKSSASFSAQFNTHNKYSSFNVLNTGLKREKLRTGF